MCKEHLLSQKGKQWLGFCKIITLFLLKPRRTHREHSTRQDSVLAMGDVAGMSTCHSNLSNLTWDLYKQKLMVWNWRGSSVGEVLVLSKQTNKNKSPGMVASEYNLSTGVVEADSWSPLVGQSIILGEFQASKESYLNKSKTSPPPPRKPKPKELEE